MASQVSATARWLPLSLTALAVAAAVSVTPPTAAAAPQRAAAAAGTADDSFYVPPAVLPPGQPGDIIRSRPAKPGPPTAQQLANAWQVMYLSTGAKGERSAVTGTVLLPKGVNAATAQVVGFGPGTHGPAAKCAPSKMIDGGYFYEQPAVNDMLRAGYIVAVSDYQGYHPQPATRYMVGNVQGAAVIDGVRAAQRLPEVGASPSAKVAFRGYSQGGGAAMWAGEMQPEYAPELKLVGVAAGGVPADLVNVGLQLDGGPGFGFLFYAFIGFDNAFPELDLEGSLNDQGKAVLAEMNSGACTMELLTEYAGRKIADLSTENFILEPDWNQRWEESKLGKKPINVPVYQYHATADELVQFKQAQTLRSTYCGKGMNVTWKTFDSGHLKPIYHGNAGAQAFLADRFAGKPATSNC
ncbi:MAG: lipase family protein [Natronosporangium sp.]